MCTLESRNGNKKNVPDGKAFCRQRPALQLEVVTGPLEGVTWRSGGLECHVQSLLHAAQPLLQRLRARPLACCTAPPAGGGAAAPPSQATMTAGTAEVQFKAILQLPGKHTRRLAPWSVNRLQPQGLKVSHCEGPGLLQPHHAPKPVFLPDTWHMQAR